jgi:hypothetical protein
MEDDSTYRVARLYISWIECVRYWIESVHALIVLALFCKLSLYIHLHKTPEHHQEYGIQKGLSNYPQPLAGYHHDLLSLFLLNLESVKGLLRRKY